MKKILTAILILGTTSFCSAMQLSFYAGGWSGTPTIVTMADPSTDAVVDESLVDPRICISQTFRVLPTETDLRLDKIAIWQDGEAPTQNPYTLRLVDLGTENPVYPGPETYAAGIDLWGGAVTLTYSGATPKSALELDFEGTEELILTAGNYYAFEITAASSVGGIRWYRTGSAAGNTYADGAAFADTTTTTPGIRDQLYKGTAGRDFGMAVYFAPEPATMFLLAFGGLLICCRRR